MYIWTDDDAEFIINCQCVFVTRPTASNNCSGCSNLLQRNRQYMTRVQCENNVGISEFAEYYLSKLQLIILLSNN